jgi:hypothetical protein
MWSFEVVSCLLLWKNKNKNFVITIPTIIIKSGGCAKQEMFWGNVGAKNKKNYL